MSMIAAFGAAKCFSFAFQSFPRSARLKCGALAFSAALFAAASIVTYHLWMRAPNLDKPLLFFEQLVAGKFKANSPAMVFVSTSRSGAGADWYIPQYIYAANLWGYGRAVVNAEHARRYFGEMFGAFPKLDYLVFYGMERPNWIPEGFSANLIDEQHQLFVFQRNR
jgi:hypothetical protein